MSKGLEALKDIAIQSVEAIIGKQEPLRTQKINELLETKQFKCIEKELKALEIIKEDFFTFIEFKEEKRETKTYYLIDFNKGDYKVYLPKEKYDLLKEVLL